MEQPRESDRPTRDIAREIATDIGPDATHIRSELDRLYITPFEIALVIATGIISSFLLGVLEGAREQARESGKALGKQAVLACIERLKGLLGRMAVTPELKDSTISDAHVELDAVRSELQLEWMVLIKDPGNIERATTAIVAYLEASGFDRDTAKQRADELASVLTESICEPPGSAD